MSGERGDITLSSKVDEHEKVFGACRTCWTHFGVVVNVKISFVTLMDYIGSGEVWGQFLRERTSMLVAGKIAVLQL